MTIQIPDDLVKELAERGLNRGHTADLLLATIARTFASLANFDPYDTSAESRVMSEIYNRLTWKE